MSPDQTLASAIARAHEPEMLRLMAEVAPGLPDKLTYRDYSVGLQALFGHITECVPEVLVGGLRIVEVGPGVGCFMVLAEALGNTVTGEEDLGPGVVDTYRQITSQWGLDIRYGGFPHYLTVPSAFPYRPDTVDLFHFRGSLDAVLHPFRDDLDMMVRRLMVLLRRSLRSGGSVWVSHNIDSMLEPTMAALNKIDWPHNPPQTLPNITRLVKR